MNDRSSFLDLLQKNETVFAGRVVLLDEVDSTNDYAKELLARQNDVVNTVVVADRQVKGKGRLGRVWNSPPDVGLWMSFILKPALKPDQFYLITYMISVAVAEAVETITGLSADLKWPNDVLLGGKKCCGILLEAVTKRTDHYLVAGVGINVNQTDFPAPLNAAATSLRIASGRSWDRHILFGEILARISAHYASPDASILEKWKSRSNMFGRTVSVTQGDRTYEAVAVDLAGDGALIIEQDGRQQRIYAADVQIRI